MPHVVDSNIFNLSASLQALGKQRWTPEASYKKRAAMVGALLALQGAWVGAQCVCPPAVTVSATSLSLAATVASNSSTSTPAPASAPIAPSVASPTASPAASTKWGTYLKPFAVDSMWNSRPVNPTLGDFVIPKSTYYPAVQAGAYSSGVFQAASTDAPMTVYGPLNSKGLWNPDAEAYQDSITIARWPANVIPATGSDGHADIVDEQQGIVHSFFKLKNVDGTWRALQYAWTKIDGSGWGDPAHYFQGARAAAVPTTGGLIRKHEINDGDKTYRHALAMSLTFNALSASPAYTFPATSADGNAASTNSGRIPEGALMMLPATFDTSKITSLALRKVAETLKTYGAYVVDRNVGTPFVIYAEIGSGYNLHGAKWNSAVAAELVTIQQQLRQVVSTEGWLNGESQLFKPVTNLNLLSMRGPWVVRSGSGTATFDTWRQALVFSGASPTTVAHFNNRSITKLNWIKPEQGKNYVFTAKTTGGATVKLDIVDRSLNRVVYSTGFLADGTSVTVPWPAANYATVLYATSGTAQGATAAASLLELTGK